MSKLTRSVTVSLLAAALLAATAAPSHAWGGGRVVIGVGPYWGPPYPYPYPYWGYPYGPYYSWQDEQENRAMAGVFITTEPAMVSGCNQIGLSGDNVKDLRRKIVRAGGNAAVLTFRVDDLKMMAAEVYKCPTAATKNGGSPPTTQAPPPPPPARSPSPSEPPPPPAGTPPPPPPGAR